LAAYWGVKIPVPRKMFVDRVLSGIFDAKEEWRQLHNEALQHSFSLLNIIRIIKLGAARWTG
jgi:hypothetical protein